MLEAASGVRVFQSMMAAATARSAQVVGYGASIYSWSTVVNGGPVEEGWARKVGQRGSIMGIWESTSVFGAPPGHLGTYSSAPPPRCLGAWFRPLDWARPLPRRRLASDDEASERHSKVPVDVSCYCSHPHQAKSSTKCASVHAAYGLLPSSPPRPHLSSPAAPGNVREQQMPCRHGLVPHRPCQPWRPSPAAPAASRSAHLSR
jgi:hypothetical protein